MSAVEKQGVRCCQRMAAAKLAFTVLAFRRVHGQLVAGGHQHDLGICNARAITDIRFPYRYFTSTSVTGPSNPAGNSADFALNGSNVAYAILRAPGC
jgi:hypothetical protein